MWTCKLALYISCNDRKYICQKEGKKARFRSTYLTNGFTSTLTKILRYSNYMFNIAASQNIATQIEIVNQIGSYEEDNLPNYIPNH